METIKFKYDPRDEWEYQGIHCVSQLEDYYELPAHVQERGFIFLYNNSNFYTPIRVVECDKKDADLHFVDNQANFECYYKRVSLQDFENAIRGTK